MNICKKEEEENTKQSNRCYISFGSINFWRWFTFRILPVVNLKIDISNRFHNSWWKWELYVQKSFCYFWNIVRIHMHTHSHTKSGIEICQQLKYIIFMFDLYSNCVNKWNENQNQQKRNNKKISKSIEQHWHIRQTLSSVPFHHHESENQKWKQRRMQLLNWIGLPKKKEEKMNKGKKWEWITLVKHNKEMFS